MPQCTTGQQGEELIRAASPASRPAASRLIHSQNQEEEEEEEEGSGSWFFGFVCWIWNSIRSGLVVDAGNAGDGQVTLACSMPTDPNPRCQMQHQHGTSRFKIRNTAIHIHVTKPDSRRCMIQTQTNKPKNKQTANSKQQTTNSQEARRNNKQQKRRSNKKRKSEIRNSLQFQFQTVRNRNTKHENETNFLLHVHYAAASAY
jgi:hypothetical protein